MADNLMPKRQKPTSRLRRFLTDNKHDIVGISWIVAAFGLLFLCAATGGVGGVANCIRSSNLERHPTTFVGTLGLIFFGAGFLATVFITASPKVRRIFHLVPYAICLIGGALVFIDEAPKLQDPFVGVLVLLTMTAGTHVAMVYEARQDAQRRST